MNDSLKVLKKLNILMKLFKNHCDDINLNKEKTKNSSRLMNNYFILDYIKSISESKIRF